MIFTILNQPMITSETSVFSNLTLDSKQRHGQVTGLCTYFTYIISRCR